MATKMSTDINGRKFALLTEQMYNSLKDAQKTRDLTESGEFHKVKSLDDQLAEILADKQMSPTRKAQEYALILKQFQSTREKAPEITTPPQQYQPPPSRRNIPQMDTSAGPPEENLDDFYIEDSPIPIPEAPEDAYKLDFEAEEPGTPAAQADLTYAAIAATPPTPKMSSELRQQRLAALKSELAKVDPKDLGYDKQSRELKIFDYAMPGSNIDDILAYVTNHRPATAQMPKSASHFLETYGNLGLDPSLIPNKKLRQVAEAARRGKGMKRRNNVIKRWQRFYFSKV